MIKLVLKGSICCIIVAGLIATSWAAEQGKLDILGKLIRDGKWTEAGKTAKEMRGADATSAIPSYVVDIASDIADDMTGQLSQYQFPFSDKLALYEIQKWAETLMTETPDNPNVLLVNAMICSPKALSDPAMFVAILEQVNTNLPNDAFILESLGSGYGAQGKYDEAISMLRRATQINPKSSGAWTNLGVAYLKKDASEEAVKALKKAVEVNSQDGTALFNLGAYYAERNMNELARPLLEKAIQCTPQLMEARWNLGGIYFNSRQRAKAVQQLKEMLKIAPDSLMGQMASQMLSDLGEEKMQMNVYPPYERFISSMFVNVGDEVIAEETKLFEMDDQDIAFEIKDCQLDLAKATALLKLKEKAADDSEQMKSLEKAKEDVAVLQLKMDSLQKTGIVYAPVNGRINRIFKTQGEYAMLDDAILQITEEK